MVTNNSANYSPTQYTIQVGGANGNLVSLGSLGTAGQVATSNGAGSAPSFQNVSASGATTSIAADSGTATPSSGVITLNGGITGLTTSASGSTVSVTGTLGVANGGTAATTLTGLLTGNGTSAVTANAITQYNVITGGASNAPNSVAPGATSGVPLISQGSSSQPAFGTAVVAGGGTGLTSTTAYAVITGGTTSTGALQSVASLGSATQVLTSNGAGALPSFQNAPGAGSLTPIFVAYSTANQTGVTGDGTFYQVHYNSTDRNDGTAFSTSTYKFTAPKTGAYLFIMTMSVTGILSANLIQTAFLKNASVQLGNTYIMPFTISNSSQYNMTASIIAQMTSGDTMQLNIAGSGNGTKNLALVGNGSAGAPGNNTFCGSFLG